MDLKCLYFCVCLSWFVFLRVNNWPELIAVYLFIYLFFFYTGSFLQTCNFQKNSLSPIIQHKSSVWPSNKYTHEHNLSVKQPKRTANLQYLLGETFVLNFQLLQMKMSLFCWKWSVVFVLFFKFTSYSFDHYWKSTVRHCFTMDTLGIGQILLFALGPKNNWPSRQGKMKCYTKARGHLASEYT